MASMSSDTPFLVMVVSSSLVISSNVKPYWKPEQPPPCTNTRSFRSGLPSSAIRSATLAAALSVNRMGAGISVWMFSATALMGYSGFRVCREYYCKPLGNSDHWLFDANFSGGFSSTSTAVGINCPAITAPWCISSAL